MPKLNKAINNKPNLERAVDVKPSLNSFGEDTSTRKFEVVLGAGQYIGLPYLLTYPAAGTVTQWSENP